MNQLDPSTIDVDFRQFFIIVDANFPIFPACVVRNKTKSAVQLLHKDISDAIYASN